VWMEDGEHKGGGLSVVLLRVRATMVTRSL
jgi:hypothetical protein